MSSAHIRRVLTAAVAIPLLIVVILKGGRDGFALLVGLTAALGILEYYALFFPGGSVIARGVILVLCLAVIGAFHGEDIGASPGVLVLVFLCTAVMCLVRSRARTSIVAVLSGQIMGFIYVPFLLGHLILIRGWNNGIAWTSFLLAVVFAGDTAAYYVGKAFGHKKLAPSISPGKTVEGAAGGLAAGLLVGSLFKQCWLPELSWPLCALLLLLLGVLAQAGDLFESMLKRSVDIKDSGRLLPGHGGVLDRIDGLLFAAPVLYYFRTYLLL